MSEPRTGDVVNVHSDHFYLGKGIITAITRKGNERIANVETFDGMNYQVQTSDLNPNE